MTLLLKKLQPRFQGDKLYGQIIFDREDHWIVASTVFSRSDQVKVSDLVFTTTDEETKAIISIYMDQKFYLVWLVLVNRKVVATDCGCLQWLSPHNFSTRT